MRPISREIYLARLEREGIKYEPIGKPKGLNFSMLHRCPKGHLFKAKPKDILNRNAQCPECFWWRNNDSKKPKRV